MNDELTLKLSFDTIRNDFSDLWRTRERGNSLEIITPYEDLYGEAISVYLTKRDNRYVVTDGGYVSEIEEEQCSNIIDSQGFHYENMTEQYGIRETPFVSGKRKFFYKSVVDFALLTSAIYDMIHFEIAMLDAIYLETLFVNNRNQYQRFTTKVIELFKYKTEPKSGEVRKFEVFSHPDLRQWQFTASIRKIGESAIWAGMGIYSKDMTSLRRAVYHAEFAFRRITRTGLGALTKTFKLGAVMDTVTPAFAAKAQFGSLKAAIDSWGEDFGVKTYGYEELRNMESLDRLFAA